MVLAVAAGAMGAMTEVVVETVAQVGVAVGGSTTYILCI